MRHSRWREFHVQRPRDKTGLRRSEEQKDTSTGDEWWAQAYVV